MSSIEIRRVSSCSRRRGVASALGAGAIVWLGACSSTTPPAAATCSDAGAAVPGPLDIHCVDSKGAQIHQSIDEAACSGVVPMGDDGGSDDGGAPGADDGGSVADAGDMACTAGYGDTLYNQQGADDDCKYDVSWTSTPICDNQPVYFTVTVQNRTDNSPVTGANTRPDVVLNCNHPISDMPADPSPEGPPGTYKVGPIVFDRPGKWVVRFHFFEMCNDLPKSPHGHVAFYVSVP